MLRKLSIRSKALQSDKNEEKEEKDLKDHLESANDYVLLGEQKAAELTEKVNLENKSSINSNFIFDNVSIHISKQNENVISNFCKEKKSISSDLRTKLQIDPFPILKQQLENGKMSDLKFVNKREGLKQDPNVVNYKILKCEAQSETDSDNKENTTNVDKQISLNKELHSAYEPPVEINNANSHSFLLEALQPFHFKNFHNLEEDKPCDLSMKSGLKLNQQKIKVESVDKDLEDDILNTETYANNASDNEQDDDNISEYEIKFNELSTQQQQQQLVLAQLSKIQQRFISNLLQYQASFLAHYQQIQQRIMLNCNSSNDESSQDDEDRTNEELQDCTDSDVDKDDDNQNEKSSSVIPPPLIPLALLGGLVPYAIYRHLLPASSENASLANLLSKASAFQQKNEDDKLNKEENSRFSTSHHFRTSLFQQHMKRSDEFSSSKLSELTSDKKCSILRTLIGSSKQTSDSSSIVKTEEVVDENGGSSFQFKRKRIAFSAKQYELLQTTFEHNNFPEPGDQQCIARQLKAPYRSIKMWFQNKRANARKKLFPGEKGSGRTAAGEKIPGDTDTRFYCDKCPSAFICQKYLKNHLDAHKVYTKSCPKCRVNFTHDCLLNTHTISKCGKKEKLSNKESNAQEVIVKEEEEELEEEETFIKINGYHNTRLPIQSDSDEGKEELTNNIMSHLNSSLPLLTLLQIQKTKAEQNLNDQSDEFEEETSDEEKEDCVEQNLGQNMMVSEPPVEESRNKNAAHQREVPPLIPTELVKPFVNNVTKFAILRQLLTNFEQKSQDTKSVVSADEDDILPTTESVNDTSDEEMDVRVPESEFKPKNIPEHLYNVLNNRNNTYKHVDDNNEQTGDEYDDTQRSSVVSESELSEKRNLESLFSDTEGNLGNKTNHGSKPKRLRRRTTVFTENQHRVLYLHFTHCNFPDPSMFRILSKLTGLTPHVIKIWFQNERSRQRRQVQNSEADGVLRDKKPYKCRDCGVEFAMPAFLVKHCMRHIPTENVTSQARKCPICMVEFETQKLHSHFMASHNLSINIEEEGTNEENICHLCKEHFSDLNSLSIHKNEHLKDTQYGDPPQCSECKTTFVNVLCLEAHMATHYKFKWDHSCPKCKMRFYDKILLESHLISHTMHNTNNAHSKSAQSMNNDSQSQFLISLIKKIADSESESAKFISSENDSVKCDDAGKRKQDVTESLVSIKVENQESKEIDSISLNGCDVTLSQVIPSLSIPVSTPLSSVSLKIIPVKFVSAPPSYSQVISDSNPVVTAAQFFSSGNNSSNSANSLRGPIALSNSSVFTKKDSSLPVEEIVPASTFTSHTKRKVPNLIPISKSGFHPQICDNVGNEDRLKYENQKENSCENEVEESPEATPSEEESPESQVLVYTPYASEYRKRRRTPTHFNSSQRDILEAYYKYDNFPDPNEQLHLSEYLKVPYSVIKTWYQNTRKNHRKHLKESLNFEIGGPFECLECRVCFVSKIYLESHVRQHKEKQPFSCQLCFRQFPHQAVYDIHARMGCSKKSKKKHEQIRPFSSLTKTFKLEEKEEKAKTMNKDSATVDNFSAFVNLPGQKRKLGFSSRESNIKYLKIEYEDKGEEQVIALPLKIFKKEDGEDAEFLSVSEETNFRCDNCHSCFPSLQSLSDHHCPNYVPQVLGYKCPECGKTFQSFLSIAEHKERHCKKLLPILPAPKVPNKDLHYASSKLVCSELIHLYPSEAINRDSKSCEVSLSTKIKEKLGFSRSNICFLQVHYKYNNFPSVKEMELMSKRLGIEREKVEHWFLRQRSRERKGSVGYKSAHECKSCPSVFVHSDALKKHEENVHNPSMISIEFFCPQEYCKAKYPNATLLQTHQMEHNTEKSTKEEKSGRSVLHHLIPLEMHYKENNFPSSAEMNFIAKRLRLDLLHVHCWFKQRREDQMALLNNAISKSECTLALSDHQLSFSSSSPAPTNVHGKDCKVCFSKFVKEDMLKNHQLIHSTNYSLVCWECGFDCASPFVLKTHMLQHDYVVPSDVLSSSKIVAVNSSVEMKYTFIQLQILYNHFKITNFPRKEEIKLISRRLKVPMKHVQTWFKYQRISELAYSKTISSTLENIVDAETSTLGGHSSSLSKPPGRSCKGSSNGVSLSKLESSSLFCGVCSSDFVSARMLERHKALHDLGRSYSCDSCSSAFLHEMVRDTHTLSHSVNGKSGNASELGLKARSKILEKETKVLLKSLILTCRDIPTLTPPLGICNNTLKVVRQNNTDIGSTSLVLNNKGTESAQALLTEFKKLKNTSSSSQNSPVGSESQNVHSDSLKYDSENDEEDDEIKLVIDE